MNARSKDAPRLTLARWLFTPLAGVLLGDWLRLLRAFGTGIPARYWARSTFTTAMALVNSALAPLERRRYDHTIATQTVHAPVFVVGHHRSGTTHLWNLLAQDPQFVYPNVLQAVFPHTFLTTEGSIKRLARRFVPRKRPQDNVDLSPDSPIEEERAICTMSFVSMQMARHFPRQRASFERFLTLRSASTEERTRWQQALDRFARKLLVRNGGHGTPLFKAPDHTGKLRYLLALYPDARIVHIHRDPYTVFRSTRRMELQTQPLYAYQPLDPQQLDDFILWRYRTMYEAFFEDREQIPAGQFAEVSFDELEAAPLATVERIYKELGVSGYDTLKPRLEQYLQGLGGYRKNQYTELPMAERRRVAEHWQEAFERLGYPQ